MWKYSEYHMNISDDNAAYHATYALGEPCGYEHVGSCEGWTIMKTFFYMSFVSFLNATAMKQLNDDQFQPEINTIINDVLCLTLMVKH